MSEDTGKVTLKNGHEVPSALVGPIMATLRTLLFGNNMAASLAIIDFVAYCRGGEPVDDEAQAVLKRHRLLEVDGRLHEVVKAVVLSAVVGDGFNLALESPYRKEE